MFVDLFLFISNPNSIMLRISFNTFEQNKKDKKKFRKRRTNVYQKNSDNIKNIQIKKHVFKKSNFFQINDFVTTKSFLPSSYGYIQLKILIVLTTKAGPPPPPGKALIVQNCQKKSGNRLVVGWTPVKKSQNT